MAPIEDASLGGRRLADYLQTFPIESRWIAGHPVIWQTGHKDGPENGDPSHSTHCSAFVAAVALGLNIYLLRPHRHKLKLLSNAQVGWLLGSEDEPTGAPSAEESGWETLGKAADAEALDRAVAAASRGSLVIAGYKNKLADKPGHLVTVLPASDDDAVAADGPMVMSVGTNNDPSIDMKTAFHSHHDAWPGEIHLFVHATELEVGSLRDSGSTAPMP